MPEVFGKSIDVQGAELQKSAKMLRKELLKIPFYSLQKINPYVTYRRGVRLQETVGSLDGDMQFGPYDDTREDSEELTIKERTLFTYFGSVVKNFSPNKLFKTVYSPTIFHTDAMKDSDIVRQSLSFLAGKLGEHVYEVLFNAVRNADGTQTKDLYNGWDTIAATEFKKTTGSEIAAANGNLVKIAAITASNAYDVITTFLKAADEKLMDQELYLFVPKHVKYDYELDYKTTTGAVPYNNEFHKTVIEGFENVTFVPLSCKKSSPFLQLTTKNNMLVGVDQDSDIENIEIARFKPFMLQFIATMFFGVDYESLLKERICFATIDGTAAI